MHFHYTKYQSYHYKLNFTKLHGYSVLSVCSLCIVLQSTGAIRDPSLDLPTAAGRTVRGNRVQD